MEIALLDTDMLSEVLKQRNPQVVTKAAAYLRSHGRFAFSAFTRFEISRGFKEKGAINQLTRFREFCQHSLIIPVTDSVLERAEDLWAIARREGMPCGVRTSSSRPPHWKPAESSSPETLLTTQGSPD